MRAATNSPAHLLPSQSMTQVRSGWLDGLTEYNGQPTENGFVIATEARATPPCSF